MRFPIFVILAMVICAWLAQWVAFQAGQLYSCQTQDYILMTDQCVKAERLM